MSGLCSIHRPRPRRPRPLALRKECLLLACLATAAVACGNASHRPEIDLNLTGGVSARLTTPWNANNCTISGGRAVLFCELTAADMNWHVYLNLAHYTGPGTYAAKGEPIAKGSKNIIEGVSVASRDTNETFLPVRGTVAITRGNRRASAGATAAGRIDADVHDDAGKVDAHISGTFSTQLIATP